MTVWKRNYRPGLSSSRQTRPSRCCGSFFYWTVPFARGRPFTIIQKCRTKQSTVASWPKYWLHHIGYGSVTKDMLCQQFPRVVRRKIELSCPFCLPDHIRHICTPKYCKHLLTKRRNKYRSVLCELRKSTLSERTCTHHRPHPAPRLTLPVTNDAHGNHSPRITIPSKPWPWTTHAPNNCSFLQTLLTF